MLKFLKNWKNLMLKFPKKLEKIMFEYQKIKFNARMNYVVDL